MCCNIWVLDDCVFSCMLLFLIHLCKQSCAEYVNICVGRPALGSLLSTKLWGRYHPCWSHRAPFHWLCPTQSYTWQLGKSICYSSHVCFLAKSLFIHTYGLYWTCLPQPQAQNISLLSCNNTMNICWFHQACEKIIEGQFWWACVFQK